MSIWSGKSNNSALHGRRDRGEAEALRGREEAEALQGRAEAGDDAREEGRLEVEVRPEEEGHRVRDDHPDAFLYLWFSPARYFTNYTALSPACFFSIPSFASG
jgi:hypothetical protein